MARYEELAVTKLTVIDKLEGVVKIDASNIPTSADDVEVGEVYSNAGVLTVKSA